jgi:hypothetical protein
MVIRVVEPNVNVTRAFNPSYGSQLPKDPQHVGRLDPQVSPVDDATRLFSHGPPQVRIGAEARHHVS